MTTTLTTIPPANLIQCMNERREAERATIALMPTFSNQELLDILVYAREMESMCWRVQCAAHAEIVNRKLPKGEKGALIEAAARQEKCAPGTLYRNADIHELAEKVQDIEDKQVFIEILSLPKEDRIEALEVIANKIHTNEKYGSPSDIKADIYAMKGGEPPERTETTCNLSLRLSQASMQKLTAICSKAREKPSEWAERVLLQTSEPAARGYWRCDSCGYAVDRGEFDGKDFSGVSCHMCEAGTFGEVVFAERGPCISISPESLRWLIEKAAKRVAQYGVDDDWGTPESYLEGVVMSRAIRDSLRSHKAKS